MIRNGVVQEEGCTRDVKNLSLPYVADGGGGGGSWADEKKEGKKRKKRKKK